MTPCVRKSIGFPAGTPNSWLGRLFVGIAILAACTPGSLAKHSVAGFAGKKVPPQTTASDRLQNLKPGVQYVGSEACATCHSEIYTKFRQTAMGQSMVGGGANATISLFPAPATVYDKDSNQYFDVVRKDGSLFQDQYSLDSNGKAIFRQNWRIDYVIGAGENGFGFLIERDHYLFEAPLSYYSKTHSWSFSPGYEIQNRGFARPILDRCIVCHSGRPNPVLGQIGLYKDPAFDELAVGCENCHGPGELHVAEHLQEKMMNLAPQEGPDNTIVNPAELSGWLADNICMRCHQGQDVRVEMPGKHVQDFRPGMPLGKVVSIFKTAPKPGASSSSLPLEHYFGMALSKCYRASGNLHCITCHDPHLEPTGPAAVSYYRSKCLRCHTQQSCQLELSKRLATNPPDNCLACHMPKRTVTTISHAALTDHSIPARPGQPVEPALQAGQTVKPELLLLTSPPDRWKRLQSVPPITLLQAYESLVREGHDEFRPAMARLFEQVANRPSSDPAALRVLAHAAAGTRTPAGRSKAIAYMKRILRTGSPNVDDYLFLADLYIQAKQDRGAIAMLEKARATSPYFNEIYGALASEYMAVGQYDTALTVLHKGIELFPSDVRLRQLQQKAQSVMLGPG